MIDGFRAYAILGVVSLHLLGLAGALQPGTTSSLIAWGLLGNVIDAFFIVSGFVLFLAVVSRDGELGSWKAFALGRGARLFPPYWITLAVMLVLLALAPAPEPRSGVAPEGLPGLPSVLVHIPALQMPAHMIDASILTGFGINGPLWMVSVIVCFYLVFPLVAGAYYRHPIAGLLIAALVTIGWREAAVHLPELFAAINVSEQPDWVITIVTIDQLPGWAFSFALGMTGAWAYHRFRDRDSAELRRQAGWAAFAALLACLACAYLYGRHASDVSGAAGGTIARTSTLLTVAYTLSRGLLMAAIALGPFWMRAPFTNRSVRSLAEPSYSVYLIHVVVAVYVGGSLLDLSTDGSLETVALWFGTVLPISFAYAYLMVRAVERPSRAWARRSRLASGTHARSRDGSVRADRIGPLRRPAGAGR